MRVRRSYYLIPMICLLGLLAGALAAAPWGGPQGSQLAFQRIAYSDAGPSPEQPRTPWLAVVASASDMKAYQHLIRSTGAAVPPIDYERSIVVIVFRGWQGNSGYDIQVDHVRASATSVAVLATATKPAPHQIVQSAVTSRCEIIAIARPPALRGPVTFQLFLNGKRETAFELVKALE